MCCDDDDRISNTDLCFTVRSDDRSRMIDTGDQRIIPDWQIFQCDIHNRRSLMDVELQCLYLILNQMIQCFHIAAKRILHGTYISCNIFGCNKLRIDQTAKLEVINDIPKGNPVDLGDDFCLGAALRKQRQKDISFVNACQ